VLPGFPLRDMFLHPLRVTFAIYFFALDGAGFLLSGPGVFTPATANKGSWRTLSAIFHEIAAQRGKITGF